MTIVIIILLKSLPKTVTTSKIQIDTAFLNNKYIYKMQNDNFSIYIDYNQINIYMKDDYIQDVGDFEK